MIASDSQLGPLLAEWESLETVAVDTEADSMHSYREKLCLVQLGDGRDNVLIDPLSAVDMSLLLDFLGRRRIILHGANFDLKMLSSVGDYRPCEVIDTVIAARLTGRTQFSLAALVSEFYGVELPKAARKADWGRRPLSPQMEEYARNDTRYLPGIADRLLRQIEQLGRMEWFRQSCEREVESAMAPSAENEREAWMVKGAFRLQPREMAVLREIWAWREQEAESRDVPPFKVMRNEDLLKFSTEIAANGICEIHYLHGGRKARFDEAARSALALDPSEWPVRRKSKREEKIPEFDEKVAAFISVRDRNARRLALEPSFVASRKAIERLVAKGEEAAGLLPWQMELIRG